MNVTIKGNKTLKKKYKIADYEERLKNLVRCLQENNISINSCGCCDSPWLYFDGNDEHKIPCFIYFAEEKSGSIDMFGGVQVEVD